MAITPRSAKPRPADTRPAAIAQVPIARVTHGAFQLKTGYWVGLIRVHGLNWDLQTQEDREGHVQRFRTWLLDQHDPWQIIVDAELVDFRADIAQYRDRARRWQSLTAERGSRTLMDVNLWLAELLEDWPSPSGETIQLWVAVTAASYEESLRRACAMQNSLTTMDPALRPWIPPASEIIAAWAHWAHRPNPWMPEKG